MVYVSSGRAADSVPLALFIARRKADVALNVTTVSAEPNSSVPGIRPLLVPTRVTSRVVVRFEPYRVRSAGLITLLKVIVKPVAVFVGGPTTTKPRTVIAPL